MMIRLLTEFAMASLLLQLFPVDARDFEMPRTSSVFYLPHESLFAKSDLAPVKKDPRRLGVVTSAVSAVVIDKKSGEILFEKNREAPRSIGSITKLMTAYVFLEGKPNLDALAEILSEDVRLGGVQHLRVGEPVRVRDLLYASLVSSDNSATAALARLSGLAYGDFVVRMNEVAASIGMADSRFVDVTGLSSKNVSVVMDIVRLIDKVSSHEVIRDATEHAKFVLTTSRGNIYTMENTNDLLLSFVNKDPYRVLVAKTGFLPEAGYCLGAMFSRNETDEIIVVVLGSYSDAGRFQDVKSLAAWTYDAYEWGEE